MSGDAQEKKKEPSSAEHSGKLLSTQNLMMQIFVEWFDSS